MDGVHMDVMETVGATEEDVEDRSWREMESRDPLAVATSINGNSRRKMKKKIRKWYSAKDGTLYKF